MYGSGLWTASTTGLDGRHFVFGVIYLMIELLIALIVPPAEAAQTHLAFLHLLIRK